MAPRTSPWQSTPLSIQISVASTFTTNSTSKANLILFDSQELGGVSTMSPPPLLLKGVKTRRAVRHFFDDLARYLTPFSVTADARRVREFRIPLGVG
jgi:hypothetical protein